MQTYVVSSRSEVVQTKRWISIALALVGLSACAPLEGEIEDAPYDAEENADALLDGVGGNNWMSALSDELLLSQLSIPGTHETMALYEPIYGTSKCQDLNLRDQLEVGVRYIDIRCRHFENAFTIHHEMVYQHANFDDVLNTVIDFLNRNPSEAVIMSVREEYKASGNSRSFEETFDTYVAKNPGRWNLGTGIPTLGEARGKITLFRRFSSRQQGIDMSSWPDNTTFTRGDVRVQDWYNIGQNTSGKWNAVTGMFNEALGGDQRTLYVNYSSGYTSFIGIPNIRSVSGYNNGRIQSYFGSAPAGRYGILAMDFVSASLASAVYNANSRSVRLRSYNFNGNVITTRGGSDVWSEQNLADDSLYNVVPGLADKSCVSFESKKSPGRYLRHANYTLWTEANSGGPFAADATFCVRQAFSGGGRYKSFESYNFPGYFIRHASGRVRIAPYEDNNLFRDDASWQFSQ